MIKDKFEIEIGEQLRSAEAPVPGGAWDAIRSQITKSPASSGSSVSPAGTVVGLVVSGALLISLAIYSHDKSDSWSVIAEDTTIELQSKLPDNTPENQSEILPQNVAKERVNSTLPSVETPEQTAAIKIISKAESRVAEKSDDSSPQSIDLQRISKNEVSHIDSHRTQNQEVRSLAGQPYESTSNESDSSQDQVSVIPAKAKIRASKTSGYAPLRVKFENAGSGSRTYWQFGSITESNDASPEVVFEKPGNYTVNLSVSNSEGDVSQDYMEITVRKGSSFYIPNSFSPNGDGVNDTYGVGAASNIKSFYMIITDQEGKTVFQTRDVNEAWDYEQTSGHRSDARYYLTYRAVGVDGKVYSKNRMPITIVR